MVCVTICFQNLGMYSLLCLRLSVKQALHNVNHVWRDHLLMQKAHCKESYECYYFKICLYQWNSFPASVHPWESHGDHLPWIWLGKRAAFFGNCSFPTKFLQVASARNPPSDSLWKLSVNQGCWLLWTDVCCALWPYSRHVAGLIRLVLQSAIGFWLLQSDVTLYHDPGPHSRHGWLITLVCKVPLDQRKLLWPPISWEAIVTVRPCTANHPRCLL